MLWIKRILDELKVISTSPIKVYIDNRATISIAHNPVLHDRINHVEVDKHFIKEKRENGQIYMNYIPTGEQVADVLMKGIPEKQFKKLIGKLAMEGIRTSLRGSEKEE